MTIPTAERAREILKTGFIAHDDWPVISDEVVAIIQDWLSRQWIPVTERLPDRHSRVLAVDDGNVIFAYVCRHQHFHSDATEEEAVSVTHWMPLPSKVQP